MRLLGALRSDELYICIQSSRYKDVIYFYHEGEITTVGPPPPTLESLLDSLFVGSPRKVQENGPKTLNLVNLILPR